MDRYYWNGVHAEPMIYERTPVRAGLRDCTTDAAGNRPDAAGYFPADYTRGGQAAKQWMRSATAGKVVTCHLTGARTHDRHVATCTTMYQGVQIDLAAGLIAAGLARDCPRFSGGRYRRFERPEAVRLGLPQYCYRK